MKKNLLLIPRKLFFICLLALLSGLVKGQDIPVTIKVINTKKEPVIFATVTVINRLDSLQTMKKVADSSGISLFNLTKDGQYIVRITSVNSKYRSKGKRDGP